MPECQRKVSPESAFLPGVSCLSPASAFRHHGQSGTSPAFPSYALDPYS